MSENTKYTLVEQMNKCKSLQSLHMHNRLGRDISVFATRPKFETIPPKQCSMTLNNNDSEQVQHQTLCRIKSVDQLKDMRQTASFENIISLYKKENDNLKKQNKFLIKQVRKKQNNQEILNNYIAQLRKQIRNLQRSNLISKSPPRPKRLSSTKVSKQSNNSRVKAQQNVYSKGTILIEEGDTWNTMYEIDELNQRFNALIEQCSRESCPSTRNLLRGKLAETAQRMKTFKKQFNMLQ